MKKSLSTFILALLATVSAWAQTFTVDNLKYEVTDGTAKTVKLTGYGTEPEGILEIPATVSYNGTDYGVTGIGYLAFNRCSKLTEVTIPNSVDNLETYAFSYCSGLTKVTLLGSVTNIGSSVFQSNTSLKQVTIGDGVTQIGENMFAYCTSLTEVTIPNSVTSIGNQAFQECNALTTVTIGENVTSIGEYAFCKCSITEVVIPDNVTDIENAAFQGASALTRVILGKSVCNIGENAFNGCPNVAEMTVKAEVPPTLGLGALTGISYTIPIYVPEKSLNAYKAANTWKDFSNLQKISFIVNNLKYSITDESNKTVEVVGYKTKPTGTLEIPATVNIDGADYSVTQIGNNAFYQCHEITELIIGKNVSSIGEYGFYDCRNIEKMTVHAITPPTVGTSGLASIPTGTIYVYKEAMEAYKVANEWKRFSYWKEITFTVDNLKYSITDVSNKTVEVIGYETKPEGKLEIPAAVNIDGTEYKVTGIGKQAFELCSSLKAVTISKNIKNIGIQAFNACNVLEEITVEATVPPTVGTDAFRMVDHNIPVYVPAEAMDSYKAAEGWKEFSNMKILPFFVNNLRYFVTDAGNKKVEVIGYETEPEGKLEIPATVNFNGADYSVSSIGKSTFYLCTKLTEVIIGKNVANIGNDAFNGCNTLKEITVLATIPPTVGNQAFALVDHNIPVYVPAEAMDSYKAAEGWKEFSNMKAIPFFAENLKYSIADASNKTVNVIGYQTEPEGKVEIPATVNLNGTDYKVTGIGDQAFHFCTKLTEVVIGKNVMNIGNDAFNTCNVLKEITVLATVPPTVGNQAFALVDHNIPVYVPAEAMDSYKAAEGWKEFSNMKAIPFFAENLKYSIADASNKTVNVIGYQTEPEEKVEIPATVNYDGTEYKVTGIGDQAFYFCTKLTEVVIGKNVMNIGNDAFNSCNVLKEITVLATVPPTVGNKAFNNVDHKIPVYVPAEAIQDYKAAEGWKEFSNMKAKFAVDNLWYIITDAGNKTVELVGYETKPEGKLEIPAAVNHNSTDYSVVRIGDKAFQLCTKLTEVTIGKNVTDIGNSAFFVCNELEKITVQATVPPTVGKEAFEYVNENVSVYVPAEAMDSYKAANVWKEFKNLKSIPFTVDNLKYSITDVSNKTVELIGYETKPEGKLEIPATVNINGADYSVTRIGEKAFYDCNTLKEMIVKAEVPPTVGKDAFEFVSLDIPVYVPAEAMDSYKAAERWRDFKNLKGMPFTAGNLKYSVTDTDNKEVEIIGYVNKPEDELEIPATVNYNGADYSVTRIGEKAFYDCNTLKEMTVKAEVPPTVGKDAFEFVSLDIPVYVPVKALDSYKAAEGWKVFKNLKTQSTTGWNSPTLPESIRIYGNRLHNPQGLHIRIYDLKGHLVYSGNDNNISLNTGVYVVRCAGKNCKIKF